MSIINYSIIIPHYNVPELLLRCLHSIPYRDDVEIIIVDDCSENFYICKKTIEEEFIKQNIRFYSTDKNSGPGVARNIGLEHASGKWIVFEDADDFFSDSFDEIMDLCVDRSEDILIFHNKAVMSDDISKTADDYMYEDIIQRYEISHNDVELRYKHYSVWGKFFNRVFLDSNFIRFESVRRGQDLIFAVVAGISCKSFSVLPYVLNFYTCRAGSLCHSWSDWSAWYRQYFPVHVQAMHYLHNHGVHEMDNSVYSKLDFIMRADFNTFKTMYSLLYSKEKIHYFLFLMKLFVKKMIHKTGEILK